MVISISSRFVVGDGDALLILQFVNDQYYVHIHFLQNDDAVVEMDVAAEVVHDRNQRLQTLMTLIKCTFILFVIKYTKIKISNFF